MRALLLAAVLFSGCTAYVDVPDTDARIIVRPEHRDADCRWYWRKGYWIRSCR